MRELWRLMPPLAAFTIPTRAIPKKRHNAKGRTPLATWAFEQQIVGPLAAEAWRQAPTVRPVGLVIDLFYFDHPPDESNALKSIEDGMNGIVYLDDEQVVYTEICRQVCSCKNNERAEIQILVM